MLKVVIRVCESSVIRLKHTESYRAVTDKEFMRYMEYNSDIDFGIVEISALASEEEILNTVKVIDYCESVLNKKVFVLSYKKDVKLDDVAYSLRELQDLIEEDTGEVVSTYKREDSLFDDGVQTPQTITYTPNDIDEQLHFDDTEETIEVTKVSKEPTDSKLSDKRLLDEVANLKNLLQNSISQYKEKDELYNNILALKVEADNNIVRLNNEVDYYKAKILDFESKNYELELSKLSNELLSYKAKLDTLDSLEEKIKDLDSLCEAKDCEIKSLREKLASGLVRDTELDSLKYKRAKVLECIVYLFNNYLSLHYGAEKRDSDILELQSKIESLESDLDSVNNSLELANKREDTLNEELNKIKAEHSSSTEAYKLELNSLSYKYNLVSSDLDTYKARVASSESAIAQNEVLKTKLGLLEQELKDKLVSLSEKEAEIKRLSLTKREVITVNSSKTFNSVKYSGKAKIVTVFGVSSCGITNVAYSISNKLKGKVLFIDLDLASPKSDKYTHKNPIVAVDGVPNSLYKTCMGVLFSLGSDAVISNYDKLAIKIHKTRDRDLTWLSGLYSDLKLETVDDFEGFINYVGVLYDYIVIDGGKLGYSSINDSLIKSLSDISFMNYVVATNDTSSLRVTRLKLKKLNIHNKICFILNLSKNSVLTEISKKSIGSSKYYFLTVSNNIFGTDKLIIEDSTIDSRLSACLLESKLEVVEWTIS